MVKIIWVDGGSLGSPDGKESKIAKTIEKDWQGKEIKEIWQEARSLLNIPAASLITIQMANGKVVGSSYLLKDGDEIKFVTTALPPALFEKLKSQKIL